MRIYTTMIESFRLFMDPEQEWMAEQDLIDTICGKFVPNHKVTLGQGFGRVLEDPDRYLVPGGYRITVNGEALEFGLDVMNPALAVVDRRGVFEAKGIGRYGAHDVVAKADHLLGAALSEFKTTLSTFDFDKYANSCQWRFMADIFQPSSITYHVFCLSEATNGVISLRGIETFTLYPYEKMRADCEALVWDFVAYVTAKGLAPLLDERQRNAEPLVA